MPVAVIVCPKCGHEMSATNMSRHYASKHPADEYPRFQSNRDYCNAYKRAWRAKRKAEMGVAT